MSEQQELELLLLKIGVKIFRSPDHLEGWEDAYNAFAGAFQGYGAHLTSRQTQLDLPNMLFNFALRSGWIPHLIVVDTSRLPDLTSAQRAPGKAYCAKPDHRGFVVVGTKQSVDWFKDRIRPAVMDWTARVTPPTSNYDDFKERMLQIAGGEPPHCEPQRITPVEAVRKYKFREGLKWREFAKHVKMSENHLRQRVCDPEYKPPMKKETLETLANKIGCQWNDLNWPNKNMPIVPLPK